MYLLDLDRGSRGPSTVTLIALLYVATIGGHVAIVMVIVKLFPGKSRKNPNLEGNSSLYLIYTETCLCGLYTVFPFHIHSYSTTP